MALAMATVGMLGTSAWASPAAAPASAESTAVSDAALATPLPAWGFIDPHHHTDRNSCQRFGGHQQWDPGRRHFFCHGGRYDQYWY
ncbi:MAG TPA: hypothetical protein VH008_00865 [Pseudonocardia sp.]|nr:hypothetical protein [Pseudonocardia sp.]